MNPRNRIKGFNVENVKVLGIFNLNAPTHRIKKANHSRLLGVT